jgi:hypothetical protein
MNKFDKSVNILLENLIFEQDQNEIDPSKIINQTASEIEKRNTEDGKTYMSESEAKYNSDQGYVDKVLNYISSLSDEQLSEETGLETAWSATKDFAGKALQKASEVLGPSLQKIGDAAADKIGEYATEFIGKEYVDDIQNNMSESIWYKIAAVLEPTGVMSWPYYRKALDLYEENKGTEDEDIYFLNLLAAQISVIPGVRLPLGILTAPLKLIKLPFSIPRRIASFVRGAISKTPSATKAAAKLEKTAAKGIGAKGLKVIKTVTRPVSTRIKSAVKATTKAAGSAAKKAAKIGAVGAKVGTVVSSGDIPQTWKDWTEAGKKSLEDAKPRERTLGKFPSFNNLSTQRF